MYELCIAHTVGKDTIIIHQRRPNLKFPFDLAHIRRIEYEDTAEGGKRLERILSQTLDSILKQEPLIGPIMEKVSEMPKPFVKTSSVKPNTTKRLIKSIPVEDTKIADDIKLTLHSIDLNESATLAHLSIENNSGEEIGFYTIPNYIVQNKKQFRCLHASINTSIPPGIEEKGDVSFQSIEYVKGKIQFNFELFYEHKFTFDVEIVPD